MHYRPGIKICGITNLSDALHAANLGADFLGFIFYEHSPRFVSLESVAAIISQLYKEQLPNIPKMVGVFVNSNPLEVEETFHACRLDAAQLSGDESPVDCKAINVPWFKAVRATDGCQVQRAALSDYLEVVRPTDSFPEILLDAATDDMYGGTGKQVAPAVIATLAAWSNRFMLAGGINADNLDQLLLNYRPWGVDICSGVESKPGTKDHRLIKEIFEKLKQSPRP